MGRTFLLSDMRKCPRCEKTGSIGNDFGFRRPSGGNLTVQSWCRSCRTEACREAKKKRGRRGGKKKKAEADYGFIEWLEVELGYQESSAKHMERRMRGCPLSKNAEAWVRKKIAESNTIERRNLERTFLFWKSYRSGDTGQILKDLVSREARTWPFSPPASYIEPDWREVIRLLIKANSRNEIRYWEYPAPVIVGLRERGDSSFRCATTYHAPYGARIVPMPAWWRDENQ